MSACLKEAIALVGEYTITLFSECLMSQLVSSFKNDVKFYRGDIALKHYQL